ncbi:MAG: SIMPL domain-containing protein [Patescibacteria group bacterium]
MSNTIKAIILGIIIGGSLIYSSFIVSKTFLDVKNLDNVISVSGSAKQKVISDSARWTGNFTRSANKDQLKEGYNQMKADEKIVSDFFIAQGFKDKFEISPVFMNEIYKNDTNAPKEYNLVQSVEIKSDDVNKMKELAKNSDKLVEKGIIFSANSVEYYYSKLPEIRISLLPEAIKDAKNRADIISKSSGKNVDQIKSVTMGVVQVMPVGAVEISDYGSYDTSGIEKEVMITVKTVFGLN